MENKRHKLFVLLFLNTFFLWSVAADAKESIRPKIGFYYTDNVVDFAFEFDSQWKEKFVQQRDSKELAELKDYKLIFDGKILSPYLERDKARKIINSVTPQHDSSDKAALGRPIVLFNGNNVIDPQKWKPVTKLPEDVKKLIADAYIKSNPRSCLRAALGEAQCEGELQKICKTLTAEDLSIQYVDDVPRGGVTRARTFASNTSNFFVQIREKIRAGTNAKCLVDQDLFLPVAYVVLKNKKLLELERNSFLADAFDTNGDGISELVGTYSFGNNARRRYFLVDLNLGTVTRSGP